MIGGRIAHFTVLEKLGEGGMGIVYKARDNHLSRIVALKVLPPDRVADPERKRRFVQEARAVSALNHPNIVTVYDLSSDGGLDFIAMEYVAGKTLDRVIGRRGLGVSEVLKYGIQITDALAAAHATGIVHRDLKPANLILTDTGLIKVLDFGLAKLVQPGTDETARTLAIRPETEEGAIVGTAAYMSPEQAEGKKIDARCDIFAFGSVLYEMITGQRAFQGATRVSTLAAIISREPRPLSEIAPDTPPELERVVARCLRKDPERRVQHIDDVKLALQEIKEELESGKQAGVVGVEAKRSRRWMWITGAMAALLVLVGLVLRLRRGPEPGDVKPTTLTAYPGLESEPSFSPDGSKVAFVWSGEKEDNYDIYIKQIGSTGPPMPLTRDASEESNPAWSPDDRYIAFTRVQNDAAQVILIPPLGGPERILTETMRGTRYPETTGTAPTGLSWTPDAKWLAFSRQDSRDEPRSIWAISVDTGERRQLTTFSTKYGSRDPTLGDFFPSFAPDGSSLAFARVTRDLVEELYVQPLSRQLQPSGQPVRISDQLKLIEGVAWLADSREVVYAGAGLLWRVASSGRSSPKRLSYGSPEAKYPAIARTPPRLAYTWTVINKNLWRLDTKSRECKMLIGSTYYSSLPQYSPDGNKIAFQSDRSGDVEVWTCNSDGSNCTQLTSFRGPQCGAPSWSPDGRWLALDSRLEGQSEIYVMQADGGTPQRITNHPAADALPTWSTDGRWIYFLSDRGGEYAIWKIPRDGGEAVQVAPAGFLSRAIESPDGKWLYYGRNSPGPLFRMAGSGKEEALGVSASDPVSLSVTRRGLYFLAPSRTTIKLLDAGTGKVVPIITVDKPIFSLTVSADDRYIVWAQTDRIIEDLMLVENFR